MDDLRTIGLLGGQPPAIADLSIKIGLRASGFRLLVDDDPDVPDPEMAILRNGPSPAEILAAKAQRLEGDGANILALANDTAHAFLFEIERRVGVPFISMIEETAAAAALLVKSGEGKVGLLASEGCLATGLYQTELARRGLTCLLAGPASPTTLATQIAELEAAGAEVLILSGAQPGPVAATVPLVNAAEALAEALADYALGRRPPPPPFAWTEVGEA